MAAAVQFVPAGDGALGRRRRARSVQHQQSVRAILHDQAGRVGHRPGLEPADRGSARRKPRTREPNGSAGLPRQPSFAVARLRTTARRQSPAHRRIVILEDASSPAGPVSAITWPADMWRRFFAEPVELRAVLVALVLTLAVA